MKPKTKLNGRPRGAKARKPEIPVLAAKRALAGIRERAEQGSPEDQRALYLGYVMAHSPLSPMLGAASGIAA